MAKAPAPKPVIRVKAFGRSLTTDSFQNFLAGLGQGADNLISGGRYSLNPITRNRTQLEWGYRGSWLIGQAVDIPAEDMTRAGVELQSSLKPDIHELMQACMRDLMVWQRLQDGIRWGRLFGGAIAVMLIDGQRLDTPLNIDSISKDAFKGLVVLDRWLVEPSLTNLITTMGPEMGLPAYYRVQAGGGVLDNLTIHHSRVLRFEGIPLPYYQRQAEMLWGESVIERIFDRLMAYDSTTAGAAQLVFKAHLRTLSIPGLRQLIAGGGPFLAALEENVAMIRRMQQNEGLTIIDGGDGKSAGSGDKMEATTYTFSGLSDMMEQFGEQLAGALEIPLVRLFGQSPGGLGSNGEGELNTYYDGNSRKQERDLRRPVTVLLDVICRSVTGKKPPPGFTFRFNTLKQTNETQRADTAQKKTGAIIDAHEAGLVSQKVGMQELKALAPETGMFSNITDADIAAADDEPPEPGEGIIPGMGSEGVEPGGAGAAPDGGKGKAPAAKKPEPAKAE